MLRLPIFSGPSIIQIVSSINTNFGQSLIVFDLLHDLMGEIAINITGYKYKHLKAPDMINSVYFSFYFIL